MYKMKESGPDRIFVFINTIFLIFVLLVVLYPIIYVISASFSDPDMLNSGKVWLLPKGVTFDGYRRVLQNTEIWIGYRNTIFYTIIGTLLSIFLTLTAAYPLSRRNFYGKNVFTVLFTFTMFFSGGLIPTFILIKQLHMYNTIWALIVPSAVSMYYIIITRTFYQSSIPVELYEAASIDGCSNTGQFIKIVLPLSTPIIAVMSLFYGIGQWNNYFSAMIYLNDRKMYPLQLILREILVVSQMSDSMMLTGDQADVVAKQAKVAELVKYSVMIISTLPLLVLYPFLQKFFVKGMLVGAIKG